MLAPRDAASVVEISGVGVAVGLEERRRDDDGDEEDSRVLHGVRGVIRDRGEGGGS